MKLKALKEEIAQFQILLERIEESQPISQLERDLVLQKIRGFYELALAQEEPPIQEVAPQKIEEEKAPEPLKEPIQEEPKEDAPKTGPKFFFNAPIETTTKKEEFPAPVAPSIVEEKAPEAPQKEEVLIEEEKEIPQSRAIETPKEETPKTAEEILPSVEEIPEVVEEELVEAPPAVPEKEEPKAEVELPAVDPPKEEPEAKANKEEYESLFVFKQATDLMSRLQQKPISDLKGSIGVGQRFRYIGELFAGDASRFDEAVDYFNRKADDFDQAREYLENKLIPEGNWMKKDKQELAKDFIKWIRRRFL